MLTKKLDYGIIFDNKGCDEDGLVYEFLESRWLVQTDSK